MNIDLNADLPDQSQISAERDMLALELQTRLAKLNDQSRIFIPLIALAVITAIPVISKSPLRFLLLLLSPFVLLPVGFCFFHLLLAWRGIAKARTRIRDFDKESAGGMAN